MHFLAPTLAERIQLWHVTKMEGGTESCMLRTSIVFFIFSWIPEPHVVSLFAGVEGSKVAETDTISVVQRSFKVH